MSKDEIIIEVLSYLATGFGLLGMMILVRLGEIYL